MEAQIGWLHLSQHTCGYKAKEDAEFEVFERNGEMLVHTGSWRRRHQG